MYYKIKEIADISGVSIRMLHYYDKISLLKPSNVSQAGYRLYTNEDAEKLSQILFYRELGFSYKEIKKILAASNTYKIGVLKMQQQILSKNRDKIDALMSAIAKSIISLQKNEHPQNPNIFTSWNLVEISRNKEQLKQDLMTHLFTYSDEDCGVKTSQYSKDDWTIAMSKIDTILNKIYEFMDKGPADIEIQQLIGKFQECINNNLIKCDNRTLKVLGNLYVDNPLYKSYIKQYGNAFPEFLKSAIDVYVKD